MRIGLGIGLNNTLFKEGGGGGNVAPSNVTAPVISGSASLGSVLSTTNGTWSGTPATFSYTYQWKRNGSPIGGATSSTYTTVVADSLANITCDVTADNGVSPTATAGSNMLTMANYTPANTVAPSISGNQWQGQVLTTTNGTWTNSPTTFTYQWRRGGVDIGGATASTYTLVAADRGTNITCVVTAGNGLSASATSNTLAILNTIVQESGSAAAGAYDINLLINSTYTSPTTQIVRVRRSGDNAEANYGVSSNGYVDWSAIITWVNAGGGTQNGFVVTIFDQSGNGRNFTQSTPSAQMQIISSGVLLTDTGAGSGAVARAAMRASGSQFYEIPSSTSAFNFLHNGGDGWILSVQRFGTTSDPNAAYNSLGNSAGLGTNVGLIIGYDDRVSVPANNRSNQIVYRGVSGQLTILNQADNAITPNQTSIINLRFDADNATANQRGINWVNSGSANQNNALTNAPSVSNATFNLQWGGNGNGGGLIVGSLQRLIIWNADLSTQRTTLTTLTNSYYGAY